MCCNFWRNCRTDHPCVLARSGHGGADETETAMTLLAELSAALGAAHADRGRSCGLPPGLTITTPSNPIVARPGSTAEVAKVMQIAARHGVAVIPVSGRTGLVGGAMTDGGLMLSVERLNRIREIRANSRIAIVEAGVVLDRLHDAAEAENSYFPLWLARGSAMIGGVLSTNAGGSNVVRYGSTRGAVSGGRGGAGRWTGAEPDEPVAQGQLWL